MQYLGGKSRISKQISEVINNEVSRWEIKNSTTDSGNNPERERERESNLTFVSLFCGSCSVETKLSSQFKNIILNDSHYYLIELYKALQNGYIPPDYIDSDEYNRVKNNISNEKSEYVGFVGFGSSFGGKWFGGYGRSKKPNGEIRWH